MHLNRNISSQKQKSLPTEPLTPHRATNTSSFYLGTGRDTNANWSNRINKDFNDLTYDVKYNLSKGKQDLACSPGAFRMGKRFGNFGVGGNDKGETKESRSRSSRTYSKDGEEKFDKHKLRLELIRDNKVQNPEKIQLIQGQKYSTLQTQGLCKFQFDNTIAGRLKHRKLHHMNFGNQTMRQIYKQKQGQQDLSKSRISSNNRIYSHTINIHKPTRKVNKDNKCHDFTSNSAHKVFQPAPQLDKFYETQHFFRTIRPNSIKQTVQMEKITGRVQPRPKQSSTLAYEEYEARKRVLRTANSHQIGRSPRNIRFGRQVILATRGCYR